MSSNKLANNNPKKSLNSGKTYSLFFSVVCLALVIITFLIYSKSLNNQFTNWDDEQYITKNIAITSLHGDSVGYTFKKAFSSFVVGNYHPLTMLSYCIEYNKYKLNPKPYHLTNLILHILNTLLVFAFIWLLTKQKWVSFITALLFTIHPMHVESVSWVSERKDVLYAFFYLTSLCTYILYVKQENQKSLFYVLTFILFLFAIFSKAIAVTIPIVFIVIDYYLNRDISLKSLKEKIPFFVCSVIIGIVAIKAQAAYDAIGSSTQYNYLDHILFSCYGILNYLVKLLIPINLSCFYAYPAKENGMYPLFFYMAPLLLLAIVFVLYKLQLLKKKEVLFGLLFFVITILLVIQLLPVGDALVADRYTYLPYIGLFFIITQQANYLIEKFQEKLKSLKPLLIGLFLVIAILFSYMSHQRSLVWKDSFTLWNNALENSPPAYISYYCRGNAYSQMNEYNKAIADFNAANQYDSTNCNLYYSRGHAYYFTGQYEKSIEDLSKTIHMNNNYFDAYLTRGGAYLNLKNYTKAIEDFSAALSLNPTNAATFCNRAITYLYMQQYQLALNDAVKARELGFNVPEGLFIDIEKGINLTKH